MKEFGHVQRRYSGYTGQKMLNIELEARGKDEDVRGGSWV